MSTAASASHSQQSSRLPSPAPTIIRGNDQEQSTQEVFQQAIQGFDYRRSNSAGLSEIRDLTAVNDLLQTRVDRLAEQVALLLKSNEEGKQEKMQLIILIQHLDRIIQKLSKQSLVNQQEIADLDRAVTNLEYDRTPSWATLGLSAIGGAAIFAIISSFIKKK